MGKAHEAFLQDILKIPGVKTAALANYRGEFLLSAGVFTPNPQASTQLGTYLVQMFAVAEVVRGKSDELTILYSEGRVTGFFNLDLLIDTPYGPQEVFLVIIGSANVNLPTLRMTVKVAVSKLKLDKTVKDLRINIRVYPQNLLTRDRMDEVSWAFIEAMSRAT
ncbi:MAG: hypothetical protein RMM17_08345 [Acidobacteriota bacterium]|nr:hypothetical protein [Blastocatellia bacterium]MDW8412676.1 hypothetical protein [Acidobacteriota bacterium]